MTGKTTRDLRVRIISAPKLGGAISTGPFSRLRSGEATLLKPANDKVRA